ncbi:MAG: aminotransferase class III-fold pyridoxal phosphate-dependent enzyme [Planctomycetota bacterium]|nr:aminotransferase class III-fold pyridoxal phosphate-dependent enzyme [Planctomycetota bacterium]
MTQAREVAPSAALAKLASLREGAGERLTVGLSDEVIERFLPSHPDLALAIERAVEAAAKLRAQEPELMALDEAAQLERVQHGLINFYGPELMNPYVALAGAGPWIVTTKGAVIHDSGGYGMLGQGHTPAHVLDALGAPQVMANVMTAHTSQMRLVDALRREVGHRRADGCPFVGFAFMNSGSESVTIAARLADVNAKHHTDAGGLHAGRPIRRLSLEGSFHGRTHRPALYSDSGSRTYRSHMATFRDDEPLHTVVPNDVADLERAFAQAEEDGVFIEAFFIEPVMGEGNPGVGVTRAFYDAARRLTKAHGSLFFVDSIQAGLRAHGVLSVVDYPGFEDCEAPDMETYSKALNAGQYPLSVLAMNERAAKLLTPGIYGNTMTAAARAMDVATAVLDSLTPALRENIREMGCKLYGMLQALAEEVDGAIIDVQGTGLLTSASLDPARFKSHGYDSIEEYVRKRGIGVIHGGTNALRFTPHFAVTIPELELMVDGVRDALLNGPRLS